MKKLNLIIEGALLIAVIVLYIMFFSKKSSPETATGTTDAINVAVTDGQQMVYINIDSLMQNYLMAESLTTELTEKSKKLEAELTNKQKKLQNQANDFQNKAQKGLETRAKLEEIQQQLMIDEQQLMQLSDNYRMQLAEEQQVMNRKVLQAIMDYLKEYNRDKGYQFIMGNAFGGNLLYANPSLDITGSVLDGINAKYRADNPIKK